MKFYGQGFADLDLDLSCLWCVNATTKTTTHQAKENTEKMFFIIAKNKKGRP
jgi:hypothetical protein